MAARSNARQIAWLVLRAVEAGAFSDAALARHLAGAGLDERDRALATQLVYGTLAWQGLTDHVLAGLGRLPQTLEPEIRTLLRMALYQLTKLDRIPEFAAVGTAVELAKQHHRGRAAGMVNALLRGFLRNRRDLRLPPRSDLAAHLAAAHSHPRWLVQQWLDQLGTDEAESLLAANNVAAPTVLRVNARRATRRRAIAALAADGCAAQPTRYSPFGLECTLRRPLMRLAAFAGGLVSAQGEASQLVAQMIPHDAERVLDCCAAPGGKATALAERTTGGTAIVAIDITEAGVAAVAAQARRLGVPVDTVRADARQLPFAIDRPFDAVLVDAPCSGLGTLRQNPEIRWRRQPADIAELARLQSRILATAAVCVRPGGCIVYATCTLIDEENASRVKRFLDAHPEFHVDDPRGDLPAAAAELVGDDGFLRTFPHRHGLDGFFAVRLKRIG